MNHDLVETGQRRQQPLPKPTAHIFDRWILEPFDLIQVGMIDKMQERLHGLTNESMIAEISRRLIFHPFDRNLDLKTVPMHLIATCDVRHRLGSFKTKFFSEDNLHKQTASYKQVLKGSIKFLLLERDSS
jgi:hypothetical protein